MDKLHKKLVKQNKHYANWHTRSGHQIVQWVVLVLVLGVFTSIFYLRNQNSEDNTGIAPLYSDASNVDAWADREVKLSELTRDLLNLEHDYRKAKEEDKSAMLTQMSEMVKKRASELSLAAEQNPSVVLRNAMPAKLRSLFPSDVSNLIEQEITKDGKLDWKIEMEFELQKKVDRIALIDSNNKRYELKFGSGVSYPKAVTGDRIRVKGYEINNKIVVSQSRNNIQVLGATTAPMNKKVAVILFNFQNNTTQPFSVDQVRSTVFGATNSVKSYYEEGSYGQLTVGSHLRPDGDVFGWYTLPATWTDPSTGQRIDIGWNIDCPNNLGTWSALAEQAAAANGFSSSNYTNVIYAFPQGQCGWSGVANSGGSPAGSWINGAGFSLGVVTHEFGHNLARHHASSLSCTDAAGTRVSISNTCVNAGEYGDPFNVMGYNGGMKQMHSFHKGISFGTTAQSWFAPSNTKTLSRTNNPDGTYTILPLEQNTSGIQTVRIPKSLPLYNTSNSGFYYLEFRQPVGYDSGPATDPFYNGVAIRYGQDYDYPNGIWQSFLIDTTPATASFSDAPLALGQTFIDPVSNISITLESYSSAGASVRVVMGAEPCQPVNPTLTMSPTQSTVAAGQTISYTMTLKNNDSAICGLGNYTVTPTIPTGWTQTPASFTESLSPGASVTRNFLVTSSATQPSGQVQVSNTAVRDGSAYINGYASASVNIQGVDTIPPTVNITAPVNNAQLKTKGKLNISATGYDNIGMASIKLYFDTILLKTCGYVTTCSVSFSLNTQPAGSHQIKADATDTSGNISTKTITVSK